jgi:molybdopterin synthase catalytic subunit
MAAKFSLNTQAIDIQSLRCELTNVGCGALATFEGWVRDHHQGRRVLNLRYEAYVEMAEREGQRVVDQALSQFDISAAVAEHRLGLLALGDIAVYVAVSAAHRDAAFAACRFIIDTLKSEVPIWKHEHYADGEAQWVHPVS